MAKDKAECEATAAKRKAEWLAGVAEADAKDAETLANRDCDWSGTLRAAWIHPTVKEGLTVRNSDEWKRVQDELYAEKKARDEKEKSDREKKEAAAAKVKEEREEREAKEIIDWAAEYGSDRLKKCLELDIEYRAIYRDERLATLGGEWQFDGGHLPDWLDPRNPPQTALDLLDEAVATLPESLKDGAALVYWKMKGEDEEDDCDGYAVVAGAGTWTGTDIVYGYDGPVKD